MLEQQDNALEKMMSTHCLGKEEAALKWRQIQDKDKLLKLKLSEMGEDELNRHLYSKFCDPTV